MRLIQLSDLMDIDYLRRRPTPAACRGSLNRSPRWLAATVRVGNASSATEQCEKERQQNTQDDGGRQREIEAEVAASHDDVAREAADGDAEHHEEAEGGDAETKNNEDFTHKIAATE